jgi:hypothetical protein
MSHIFLSGNVFRSEPFIDCLSLAITANPKNVAYTIDHFAKVYVDILETIVFKDSLQRTLLLLFEVNLIRIIIISNFTIFLNYDLLKLLTLLDKHYAAILDLLI